MDYQNELNKLSDSAYWKPKAGQFKIKALSELLEAEPFIKKIKNEQGVEAEEKSEQFKLVILIGEEQKVWTFGKGKTPASTYGQLLQLAVKNNNNLTGVEFIVVVKFDGTKNDYTIV